MTKRGRNCVPELIAKLPLGTTPLTLGQTTLAEWPLPRMTSVSPFQGQDKAVAKVLKSMGLTFPAPNRTSVADDTTLIRTGRNQAFLLNADPASLAASCALTGQSDGWAGFTLQGPSAEAVLARLIPLDLRAATFPVDHTARSALNHMNLTLWRTGPSGFTLLVFRSMARTAWHEIEAAMQMVAARANVWTLEHRSPI
jgi:heterotetrameric sarcosine oxidase gamma subunit